MSYVAIMEWDGNNRVTRYQPLKTQAEADAFVTEHEAEHPDAFSAEHPGVRLEYWLVDPVAKTLSVSIDAEHDADLDEKIRQMVRAEAHRRTLGQYTQDQINQFYLRTFVLLIKVAKGVALTSAEQTEAQNKQDLFDWVDRVFKEAQRFIRDDLPLLTEDEKLNFNPAAHPKLKWPSLT